MPIEADREECRRRILSEDYGDFLLEFYFVQDVDTVPETYCTQVISTNYASLYISRQEWEPLSYSKVPYPAIPKLYTKQDTTSMTASGIVQVQQSALGITGQGVLIGIIDTGIDYQNPVFRNPDGSTRIEAIWDQTVQTGEMPLWMSYGSEYRREQINEALRAEDPLSVVPSQDLDGHGTFLAGIAAGSERSQDQFVGAAPQAQIAVVKLKPAKQYLRDFFAVQPDAEAYQENDIMLAVSYLRRLRAQLSLPLVILCGMGTNFGGHTGSSRLSRQLELMMNQPAISAVFPVGNETGLGHHVQGKVEQQGAYQDVEIRVAEGERGFQLELWSEVPDQFTVAILSPGGDYVSQIPSRLGEDQRIDFVLEDSTVDVSYRFPETPANDHLVVMRFLTPAAGVWTVRVFCTNYLTGIFHMWLPAAGLIRPDTVFLNPSPNTTLMVPSAAESVLSVAAYNHITDSIYIRSGRGYTRSGRIKPDLAAPGVDVYGPAPGGRYTRRTGTSVAAAHVAGAVACLMEWGIVRENRLWLNNNAIRAVLIQGAGRNPNVTYPNREWGYGTLDLYRSFLDLR